MYSIIPVIAHSAMGDSTGLIYFTTKGETMTPDFTSFERYLDLYIKHCGPPKVLILNVWDAASGNADAKVFLSVVKGAGQFDLVSVPAYAPEHKTMWKNLFDGVYQRAEKRGIARHCVLAGTPWDVRPRKDQVDFIQEVAGQNVWANFTHGYGGILKEAVYVEQPDGPGQHGHGNNQGQDFFLRGIGVDSLASGSQVKLNMQRDCHDDGCAPWIFRILHDISVDGPFTGLARIGLNHWNIPTATDDAVKYKADRRHRPRMSGFYNRYGVGDYGRLYRHPTMSMTIPGPRGLLETTRFQALREGFQQAEARLVCEAAIKKGGLAPAALEQARTGVKTVYELDYALDDKGNWRARRAPFPAWQDSVLTVYNIAGAFQNQTNTLR